MRLLPAAWCVLVAFSGFPPRAVAETAKPNILVILADDLGYGDVQCFNPTRGKIPTPNLDRLAKQGMLFTDGHASSAVCSPSRYSLLTGRFHWRTRLQSSIVGLWGKPLIAPDRLTLAGFLKEQGYNTAMVGKWHLGDDWHIAPKKMKLFRATPAQPGAAPTEEQLAAWKEAFSQPIGGGPFEHGFDSYFGTDVPNWPPYAFIKDNHIQGMPSTFLAPAQLENHLASAQGPALANWDLEAILPTLIDHACGDITRLAKAPKPFFLYLALTAPHTPIAVLPEWRDKSKLSNSYADYVMETDAAVGRVLDALEKSGAAEHTMVVFSSDNGCAAYVGAKDLEAKGHFPSGPFRGYKSDAWEGGHREPFMVRWPGVVQPGSRTAQPVEQADLMATFAAILGVKLPDNAGEDSVSLLPILQGRDEPLRDYLISTGGNGVMTIRKGPWKFIAGNGAGQLTERKAPKSRGELYNLADDPAETKNLYAENPSKVAELTALLEKAVADGRTTPGAKQANDVTVNWKRFFPGPNDGETPEKKESGGAVED